MAIRIAKHGYKVGHKFYGCTGFPNCKHTEVLEDEEATNDIKVIKEKFLGCSNYPNCKHSEPYTGKVTDEELFEALL
jgi:ssDNA-binding Zn-finger/Zn-ribbon topoisomerase 1